MPKFKADKEALQKALLTYDTSINIQDVVGKFQHKRGSAYDGLLIRILLDVCCSLIEPDSSKKNQLLAVLEEGLIREKVLNKQTDFSQLKGIRRDATGWFMSFISKIFTNMPNPVTSSVQISNYSSTKIYPNTYDQNFKEIKVIASGGFGTVCKAKHKIDGNVYAVKKIYYSMEQEKAATKVLNEVRSISALSHANVVSYKNCWVQLLNRDDVEDENLATPCSFASRVTDCSTPCSSRPRKKTLLAVVGHNPLGRMWDSPGETLDKFSDSSDSLEDTEACLDALELCSSLSYREESSSLVQFDCGDCTVLEDTAAAEKKSPPPPHRVKLTAMLCIQMEYCDWDLNQWLEDRAAGRELPFAKGMRDIFRDIVRGVVHIHSKSIIHRDLKPSNIFYSERDGAMKIGDFGLATLGFSETSQPRVVSYQSHTSNLGTFPYMAPEQKNRRNYDEKVDIYSLGIILIELLMPFKTRAEFHHTLTDIIERGVWPINSPPAYVDLVKNLTAKDPKQRMSAKEILDLSLMQDDDSAEGLERRRLLDENQSLRELLREREAELELARAEISRLKAELNAASS